MARGVLFAALAVPEHIRDRSRIQKDIDYNIRLCTYFILLDPSGEFDREHRLALECRDDSALPLREVAIVVPCTAGGLEHRVRTLLEGWLGAPATETSTRPAVNSDEDFVRRLIQELVCDELGAAAWPEGLRAPLLDVQYQARMRGIRETHPRAQQELITLDGIPVGWLAVARSESEIRLVDIVIAPAQRGRGLGTIRLRHLIAEADRDRKPVRLSVVCGNRAATLYRRLGFVPTGGDGVRIFMERPVQSAVSA